LKLDEAIEVAVYLLMVVTIAALINAIVLAGAIGH
jgi:hypothetical protein